MLLSYNFNLANKLQLMKYRMKICAKKLFKYRLIISFLVKQIPSNTNVLTYQISNIRQFSVAKKMAPIPVKIKYTCYGSISKNLSITPNDPLSNLRIFKK